MLHRDGGIYRRRIVLEESDGLVRAAVEDDFHHFEVDLHHEKGVITAVEGRAVRHPWSTCPGASSALRDLVGQAIETRIIRRKDVTDVSLQCTHQCDLAILAVGRAARGNGRTRYDIEIPDRADRRNFSRLVDGHIHPPAAIDGHTTATLHRDGEIALRVDIEGLVITAPAAMVGLDYRKLGKWAETSGKSDDEMEALKVLRQGIFVSNGRASDWERAKSAGAYLPRLTGACYVFQPGRDDESLRVNGSSIDFTDRPDALLADFR